MKLALAPTQGVEFQLRQLGTALDNNLTVEDNFKLPTVNATSYAGGGSVSWVLNESRLLKLTVTNSTAFVVSYTTNGTVPLGSVIIVDILNSTGSGMGTVTFGTMFKTAGPFTSPTASNRRTITFYYDGANAIEIARSAGDIFP